MDNVRDETALARALSVDRAILYYLCQWSLPAVTGARLLQEWAVEQESGLHEKRIQVFIVEDGDDGKVPSFIKGWFSTLNWKHDFDASGWGATLFLERGQLKDMIMYNISKERLAEKISKLWP